MIDPISASIFVLVGLYFIAMGIWGMRLSAPGIQMGISFGFFGGGLFCVFLGLKDLL